MVEALKFMNDQKMYKKLVFYLEACESGSMFKDILPSTWNMYTTTAANERESSWATYCSPNDKINGKSVGSCLGDEYSVNWMEDTEAAEHGKHLQKQFEDVRTRTKGSHVQQYGDLTWVEDSIHDYHGDVTETSVFDRFYNKIGQCANKLHAFFNRHKNSAIKKYKKYLKKAKESRVDSRDVKLHYLMQKYTAESNSETEAALTDELLHRKTVDNFFTKFNEKFAINGYETNISSFECLKRSVNAMKSCASLDGEYMLKYVKSVNTACNMTDADSIETFIQSSC